MMWLIPTVLIALVLWFTWRKPRLSGSVVWSLVATVLLTSALMLVLPGPLRERVVWVALASPLIWVGAIFWCHWDARPRRPQLTLIGVALAAGLVVYLLPPPG
ncbi:MAG: hypothetical protein AAGA23_05030 [Pseudomonadota bacterium]